MPRETGFAIAIVALLLGAGATTRAASGAEAAPKPVAASDCRKSDRCTPSERELGGWLADTDKGGSWRRDPARSRAAPAR
ncbi:hypothetical protein K32_43380 [Kaistia sp. 32K]|uniref:hypothetical protein n=1 Tax=Kaistia sp. 32K TaxID=2795690 RepID=UPI0019163BE9|nr:hypothetical protein [Kaistia sp. 32K]BCP55721.1 hypothetical protein K32_43380 [Kaistia sp. 32K]